MTFKHANRVEETSVTTGTGTYTLDGAPTGRQSFVAGIGANNYCTYVAADSTNWELVLGQVLSGPNRATRDTILASSNGGAAVNWGAGTRTLREALPAELGAPRTLSLSVAGGAGTTILTQDQQRRNLLAFTGALTGNRIMEVDATPWEWVVYNNTSGAFTLTVRVTGQTGLAITQGKRRAVYCDGVDVRNNQDDSAAAPEFAGGGTVRMLFQQTSAPTGWTKETNTAFNDVALRIVTGTVGGGGANLFTGVFAVGRQTDATTLSTAQMPAHTHTVSASTVAGANISVGANYNAGENTSSTGGGGSHVHTVLLDVAYKDVIVAAKD